MKILNNYNDFILDKAINETRIYYSPKFREIISKAYSNTSDERIRTLLARLYHRETTDLERTDITFVDISKDPSYVTHTRASNINKLPGNTIDIINKEFSKEEIDKIYTDDLININSSIGPFTDKSRSSIKLSRLINKILEYESEFKFTEAEKEKATNLMKSEIESIEDSLDFKIVNGEEIVEYYKSDKYYTNSGTLGNSCMKRMSPETFDIYVKNPEVCSLLVLLDSDGLVLGRALLWELSYCSVEGVSKFMDRIYTAKGYDVYKFRKWAIDNNYAYKEKDTHLNLKEIVFKNQTYSAEIKVKLNPNITYIKYPYVDTFRTFNPKNKILYNNKENKMLYNRCYLLEKIDGGYNKIVRSEELEEPFDIENIKIIYSKYYNEYLPEIVTVYSKPLKDFIIKSKSVQVKKGRKNNIGYYPETYDLYYSSFYNCYLVPEDAIYSNSKNTYVLKKDSASIIYEISEGGIIQRKKTILKDEEEYVPLVKYKNSYWFEMLSSKYELWLKLDGMVPYITELDIDDEVIPYAISFFCGMGEDGKPISKIDSKVLNIRIVKNEIGPIDIFKYSKIRNIKEIIDKTKNYLEENKNTATREWLDFLILFDSKFNF